MARNVNDWYTDVLYSLKDCPREKTRNGWVKSAQGPTLWNVLRPMERVLFCPKRRANPYLHVMETVWMFAGANKVDFLLPFSKQMGQYAEKDGHINGAYGYRWRNHFGRDQIAGVITELETNPESRQAVMAMYDPRQDHSTHWKDRPCNTHVYFRVARDGRLDMTVCNRSNDVVWGMCGANAVHMTYLHELVARAIRHPIGIYHVMTNNAHIYEPMWGLLKQPATYDYYEDREAKPYPLLHGEVDYYELLNECQMFVDFTTDGTYKSKWINGVVVPMYEHYMCRLNGDKVTYDINETLATDWRLAEEHWREEHA